LNTKSEDSNILSADAKLSGKVVVADFLANNNVKSNARFPVITNVRADPIRKTSIATFVSRNATKGINI